MELPSAFYDVGIALGLGLLVGLERERTEAHLAGVRTFPLITVLGTLCALLGEQFGGWVVGLGLLGLAGIIVMGNVLKMNQGKADPGLTSEVAMLVMFGIGAYLVVGQKAVAVALGAGVSVLLHLKPQMHSVVAKIGDQDFKAIMQFVLITLVVLPVLPNEFYGPYQVLNPFRIWLMVVLIVGISLAGYVIYKLFGEKVGTLVGGILGGLISSTATTVSYARRSRETPAKSGLAASVIMMASTIVFVRVLILIGATAPGFLRQAAAPLGVMLAVSVLLSAGMWWMDHGEPGRMPVQENPSEFKPALVFAALYAIVLLAVAAAKQHFGAGGLYVVSVLSGLTDMDAITLSITQLVTSGQLPPENGWRLILVASMSNLVFKGAVVAVMGSRKLFGRMILLFTLAFVAGLLTLFLWPGQGL